MKYKVRYLETTRSDREMIKAHLDQYSKAAAKRLFNRIRSKMELVKQNGIYRRIYDLQSGYVVE